MYEDEQSKAFTYNTVILRRKHSVMIKYLNKKKKLFARKRKKKKNFVWKNYRNDTDSSEGRSNDSKQPFLVSLNAFMCLSIEFTYSKAYKVFLGAGFKHIRLSLSFLLLLMCLALLFRSLNELLLFRLPHSCSQSIRMSVQGHETKFQNLSIFQTIKNI